MEKGIIFDIRHFSTHDGPGIRTTVFFKGCPLRCIWCHNPESQKLEPEAINRTKKLDGQEFEVKEILGRYISSDEVIKEIETQVSIFDESNGGVTFSGGEPLMQPRFLLELLKRCREHDIHTAVDTCGFAAPELFRSILPYTNLFLYDLKIIKSDKHKYYTAQPNEIILNNLSMLNELGASVMVRVPLIPGITDDEENLLAIKEIVKGSNSIKRLDLLPYHHMAKDKYRRLNLPFELEDLEAYKNERLKEIELMFSDLEMPISIGG
ncbi:MAG: pyruvate formate lyase activating enzyme [Tenuifilum sp.]|jgi:pyruvate formate lyase activating enzyme|uniref:glycyl-radical enzyme activating protein n=1 Tax=Tenuifilum sp. TaxID=2760880 RepID=UPI0024AC032C|nr:glycyl-radical enzyme activating protein [Tenuifilum sp.]MDI3526963.1 pyruvate formate lyase activating enzyme [Tenuifilum sp.]